MTRPALKTVLFLSALVAAAVAVGTARADGLPVVGVNAGPGGVAAPAGDVRFVALPAREGTVVVRIARDGGRVLGSAFLQGRFAVPVVAFDGSASGVSADGRTLVLVRPRVEFPRAQTAFAILDARRTRLRDVVTLRGDFSFDAISPNGAWLFLVEYVNPRDPTRYLVRAYDVRAGRLLPEPIVDPRERAGAMRGFPITRATSPDGRWAYTLYDGAGEHPFIHALDTRRREAVCIDLHALAGRQDFGGLRLAISNDGGKLTVQDLEGPLAVVDTTTFRVSEPPQPAASRPTPKADRRDDAVPWAYVGAGGSVLALGMLLFLLRRRPGADLLHLSQHRFESRQVAVDVVERRDPHVSRQAISSAELGPELVGESVVSREPAAAREGR